MIELARGLLGLAILLALAAALSLDRRAIRPRVIVWGLGLQLILAFLVFKTGAGQELFRFLAASVQRFLEFSHAGSAFVFGSLGIKQSETGEFHLAFQALPILIYFAAVMSILYHLGILQVAVYLLARLFSRLLGVSGAESMAVTANTFVGMTEAPLVVRPYIERMTRSELMTLMTGGFATIAGTVLGVYMLFVGESYGAHLITASVLSAPAAFVVAKIILPETESPETGASLRLVIEKQGVNLFDAISLGVRDGLKLALNIAAMLIAFVALLALINWPLDAWFGVSLQQLFGYLLAPVAWCLGVDWEDAALVGSLLGTKIAINEFLAYSELGKLISGGALAERSRIIATFALCGFANFGSIGVMLGGLGQLAPSRRPELARFALRAMLGGALASFITAAVAGMLAA
jgi:CNT family concentrative nucleoside transporter